MNKTISINPELFKFSSGGKTRKKREPSATESSGNVRIKVKPAYKDHNKSTKRALLKYIRSKQQENFDKLAKGELANPPETIVLPETTDKFNSEFDESLKYLKSVVDENATTVRENVMLDMNRNRTLRQYNHDFTTDTDNTIINNISMDVPDVLQDIQAPMNAQFNTYTLQSPKQKMVFPNPKYGCLKGGTLPTYRKWNSTQKILPNQHTPMKAPIVNQMISGGGMVQKQNPFITSFTNGGNPENKVNAALQLQNKMKAIKQSRPHIPKQRRTVRRTYQIGKSKTHGKVSVLISNKTIRKNTATKAQLLKQVPLPDVKKYLIKHGFIKIGTTAPNDVLRKIYETAVMVCGDIQNHNPDNLLYNFFNDIEAK
jgi:hypothetical protein